MYRCQICGGTTQPRVPARRIVLETREVKYPERPRAMRHYSSRLGFFLIKPDYGGKGREIVREALACPECAVSQAVS